MKKILIFSVLAIHSLITTPVFGQSVGIVTKQYDDGGVYEGTFRDGLQHGEGTYRLPNGYEYSGNWEDGEIKGKGLATFPNGSIYEGSFANSHFTI